MRKALLICGLFALLMSGWLCYGDAQEAKKKDEPIKAADIPSFDKLAEESELVATFYRLLLQDEAPTLKDELSLFGDTYLRNNLIEVHGKNPDDPVVLNLCREHLELFVPENVTKHQLLSRIMISAPFDFPRNLKRQREVLPGIKSKHVMVWLLLDQSGKSHELLFLVQGEKLNPDNIWLDGLSSTNATILGTRFLKTKDGKWAYEVPGRE